MTKWFAHLAVILTIGLVGNPASGVCVKKCGGGSGGTSTDGFAAMAQTPALQRTPQLNGPQESVLRCGDLTIDGDSTNLGGTTSLSQWFTQSQFTGENACQFVYDAPDGQTRQFCLDWDVRLDQFAANPNGGIYVYMAIGSPATTYLDPSYTHFDATQSTVNIESDLDAGGYDWEQKLRVELEDGEALMAIGYIAASSNRFNLEANTPHSIQLWACP